MADRVRRLAVAGSLAAALPVAALVTAGGPWGGRAALGATLALTVLAIALPGRRALLTAGALALGVAVILALMGHFLLDHFTLHTVWALSAPELEWYLKAANVWGGDEGTLLLLGVIALGLAARLASADGWAAPGALAIAFVFLAGAIVWDPFRPTPPDLLAEAASRGMNAHLTRVWMLVHPPLVFAAYMLLVAPAGAALEALVRGTGAWGDISARYSRATWLVLSAGIGFGMWWAYEDFTYGTLWHWDPVQTGIFMTWCLVTAQLHCQKRFVPGGAFGVLHPVLGLLAGASAMLVMAITRSSELASSHRYVGETSLTLLIAVAGALVLLTAGGLARRLASGRGRWTAPRSEPAILIWVAVVLFAGLAAIAAIQIALAYANSYLGNPRPETLKPFFEMLRGFSSGAELAALRQAFAQWDIDYFAMNRWLAPVIALAALTGGHYFLPGARWVRWCVSFLVVAAGLVLAATVHPLGTLYRGTGLTAGETVDIFASLELLIAALAYLALGVSLAAMRNGRRGRGARVLGYSVPVALVHAGAAVALAAGVVATVLDSYDQRIVQYPGGLDERVTFPGGYSLKIALAGAQAEPDGGLGSDTFHAVAGVDWRLDRDGRTIAAGDGHTVYRDDRPRSTRVPGSMRLVCEIVDYRYARYLSDGRQMIHPLISRGLWRDVQVWFPAASVAADGSVPQTDVALPVVLKVFPLLSWVWVGLVVAIGGFAALFVHEIRSAARPRRARSGRRPPGCGET